MPPRKSLVRGRQAPKATDRVTRSASRRQANDSGAGKPITSKQGAKRKTIKNGPRKGKIQRVLQESGSDEEEGSGNEIGERARGNENDVGGIEASGSSSEDDAEEAPVEQEGLQSVQMEARLDRLESAIARLTRAVGTTINDNGTNHINFRDNPNRDERDKSDDNYNRNHNNRNFMDNTNNNNFGCDEERGYRRRAERAESLNMSDVSSACGVREGSQPVEVRGMYENIAKHSDIGSNLRNCKFTSGLKIGEQVPMRVKGKIWAHAYVEFSTILYPEHESEFSLAFNNVESQPTLQLRPRQKRTLREDEWSSAFDTFVAVYVDRYPKEIQDLLTYGQSIKAMMRRRENWSYYDKQYRIAREFSKCSWDTARVDLMMQAQRYVAHNNNRSTYNKARSQVEAGYCFRYHNRMQRCQHPAAACKYKHCCPRCGRTHPQFLPCRNNANQNQQASNGQ